MRPTFRCVLLVVLAIPIALLPAFFAPWTLAIWIAWMATTILAVGLDAIFALPAGRLRVAARAPRSLFVGDSGDVECTIDPNGFARRVSVEVLLDVEGELTPPPIHRTVLAGAPVILHLPVTARRRGTQRIVELALRWTGPFGLLERRVRRGSSLEIAVVPDIRHVRAAALQYALGRRFVAGSHVERTLGDGTEFDALREYARGMDPRSIDWKASARHRRLIAEENRAERDRQVLLSIDLGRLMQEPLDGLARSDHAIHAALLLGWVALRTGDRVGLHAFDARPRLYVPPSSGLEAFARLQAGAAGIVDTATETNYTLGLLDLATRVRRRSLVVVFTDFTDSVTAELMLDNVARLVRRHVVVFVALRDPDLDALEQARPDDLGTLHRAVVAAEFVRERGLVLRRLERMGVRIVDAAPADLASGLLATYLRTRARELVG